MHIESLYTYCTSKTGVTESFPFNDEVLVFKVMNKMFALVNVEKLPVRVNLKCNPSYALELRAQYEAVQPGYHMNKKHWNTVDVQSDLPDHEVRSLIDHSYDLVVKSLRKSDREALATMG